jgi:hypothetical protein
MNPSSLCEVDDNSIRCRRRLSVHLLLAGNEVLRGNTVCVAFRFRSLSFTMQNSQGKAEYSAVMKLSSNPPQLEHCHHNTRYANGRGVLL